jgi:hypothetical protein
MRAPPPAAHAGCGHGALPPGPLHAPGGWSERSGDATLRFDALLAPHAVSTARDHRTDRTVAQPPSTPPPSRPRWRQKAVSGFAVAVIGASTLRFRAIAPTTMQSLASSSSARHAPASRRDGQQPAAVAHPRLPWASRAAGATCGEPPPAVGDACSKGGGGDERSTAVAAVTATAAHGAATSAYAACQEPAPDEALISRPADRCRKRRRPGPIDRAIGRSFSRPASQEAAKAKRGKRTTEGDGRWSRARARGPPIRNAAPRRRCRLAASAGGGPDRRPTAMGRTVAGGNVTEPDVTAP